MIHHERSLNMDASPQAVWEVLSRYMHIDAFAPAITSVEALTEGENGVGSRPSAPEASRTVPSNFGRSSASSSQGNRLSMFT